MLLIAPPLERPGPIRLARSRASIAGACALLLATGCAQPVLVGELSPPARAAGVRSVNDPSCVERVATRRDTMVAEVYATVGFDRTASPSVARFRNDVLRSLIARYSPPQTLTAPMVEMGAFSPAVIQGLSPEGPLFDGELLIVFDANGRVEETRVVTSPDSPELLPALITAVNRTDSARGFPPLPGDASSERTPVRIRLFGTRSTVPRRQTQRRTWSRSPSLVSSSRCSTPRVRRSRATVGRDIRPSSGLWGPRERS